MVKIKDFGKYTSDIKDRIKEAQNAGKTLPEIAKIFDLKPHQVFYINRCNKDFLVRQLRDSVNAIPNRGSSPMTVEKLKVLLHRRRIQI